MVGGRRSAESRSLNAWMAVDTPQGDAGAALGRRFARDEMLGEDIPHRLALLLVDRSPSRHLVALAGLKRSAAVELQVGNPPADRFSGRAGEDKTTDAKHVSA